MEKKMENEMETGVIQRGAESSTQPKITAQLSCKEQHDIPLFPVDSSTRVPRPPPVLKSTTF